MQLFLTIIAFILIFSGLVLVHEFGHFWFAKRAGIRVEEFGMGLPPRIWGKKKGETLYSINAIPFGGFVRLFGEDPRDPKALKSKRSFISKSLSQRFMVVFAGVMMNFLLALVLLSLGFTFGIKPLMVNSSDLFANLRQGVVSLTDGIVVREVSPDSWASQAGILRGDVLYAVNERVYERVRFEGLEKLTVDNQPLRFVFSRNGSFFQVERLLSQGEFGLEFYEHIPLPRQIISQVSSFSDAQKAGLLPGDVILRINGQEVFSQDELEDFMNSSSAYQIEVMRNGSVFGLKGLRTVPNLVVGELVAGGPADLAGFMVGDVLVSASGRDVTDYQVITELQSEIADRNVEYVVMRQGNRLALNVDVPESGLIGMYLSNFDDLSRFGLRVFQSSLVASITNVAEVKVPFYQAPVLAWTELKRLTLISFVSIKGLFRDLIFSQSVPEDVGGPVKIAQLTYSFVEEGFWSLVRFAALLSMSLGVINLVPIPALDGGRLLFILIEFVRGKPVDVRFESFLHRLGFLVLIALIFLVTYNDIVAIVKG